MRADGKDKSVIGGEPRREKPILTEQMAATDAVVQLSRQPVAGRLAPSVDQLAKSSAGGRRPTSSETLDLAFSDRGQVDVDGARFVGARRRAGRGSGSS